MTKEKLSKKQEQRLRDFEDIFEDRRQKGYHASVRIVSLKDSQLMPLLAFIVWVIVMILMQVFHYSLPYFFFIGPGIILGTIARELIRALTYSIFSRHGFADICFHMTWHRLLFQCDVVMPISKYGYAIGHITPVIILSLVPMLWGAFYHNNILVIYGVFMLIVCMSDLIVFFKVMHFKSSAARIDLYDHPVKSGYVIFEK